MELVYHNVVIAIRDELVERPAVVALNRNEQLIELFRLLATEKQVAEVWVAKHGPERLQTLAQQLLSVRDEEKPWPLACVAAVLTRPLAKVSKVAATRSQRWGDSYWLTLTVHSRPSVRAGRDMLAEPT